MPGESGGYLPPVVASLLAESGDLVAKVMEAKAALADFAKSDTTARIGANVLPLEATIASTKMQLLSFAKEVYRAQLGADAAPFMAGIAELKTMVRALSPMKIEVDADIHRALAKLAELKGALAMAKLDQLGEGAVGGAGGGGDRGAGGLGFLAGLGGGKGAGGLLSFLGWGKGMGVPGLGGFLGGMAGFGTPLGLAGFGMEHVLTSILGLGGSAVGGLGGGALLGLGSAGVSGVGGLSDSVVMKSTLADTKELNKTYQNLQQAIAMYGAGSAQAAYYTKLLNVQMEQLGNTAGVQAEMGLVKAADAVNQQWDEASSDARVQAVNILTQVLGLAETYIPLVTGAAARNLAIINTALKPLFSWLQGPATVIFQGLENMFANRLPTAVDAFNQGIMLLIRTIDVAAQYTGGFLPKLDRFLQYANSDVGFGRWAHEIGVLIGLFRTWEAFVGALGRVLLHTLGETVGVGTSIIETLTGMLNKLDKWLTSTQGKAEMKSLFAAHKEEVIALLNLLPALGPMADLYIRLAVPMTKIATAMVGFIDAAARIPGAGPVLTYGLAFAFIASRLGLLTPLVSTTFRIITSEAVMAAARTVGAWAVAFVRMVLGWMAVQAQAIAVGTRMAAASVAAAAQSTAAWVVASARQVGLWIAQAAIAIGRVAVMVAANVAGAVVTGAAWALAWIIASAGLILLVALIVAGVVLIITHWSQIKTFMAGLWASVQEIAGTVWSRIVGFAAGALAWVESNWPLILGYLTGPFGMAVTQIVTHFDAIKTGAQALVTGFYNIGQDIVHGLINGITSLGGMLSSTAQSLVNNLSGDVKKFLGIGSPSRLFAEQVGVPISQGIAVGIHRGQGDAVAALVRLNQALQVTASGFTKPQMARPSMALAGAGGGFGSASIHMPITVSVTGGSAHSPHAIGGAVAQEVSKQMNQVLRSLRSGAYTPGHM